MTHTLNSDQTVAVAVDYFWLPMKDCPRGVKVQLRTKGGVAIYGQWRGNDEGFFVGWAPMPKEPDWMKS